jgi:putative cell wall-binding protein
MSGKYRRVLVSMLIIALMTVLTIPTSAFGVKAASEVGPQVAYLAPDKYEPDDTFEEAYVYDPAMDGNTFYSRRTFDGANEVVDNNSDFIAITVEDTGTPIWVETMMVQGDWDTYVYMYDESQTQVVWADDNDWWDSTYSESVYYVAPEPGTYYVEIQNRNMMAEYDLFITVGDARRVSGDNRYETAAEISRLMWDQVSSRYWGSGQGPQHIVVANGKNPADALAGGSLAAQLGGIMLLTESDYLPKETRAEIVRVTEALYWGDYTVTVWVLGGSNAVSEAVFDDIAGIRNVDVVNRISGATRYDTAAEIANTMATEVGVGTTAYIVNGAAWADALAVGPVAAYNSAPVLLTAASDVPSATLDWLDLNGVTNVVVVGGTGVVSAEAYAELEASYTATRVAGDTRYDTAKEVALWGVNNLFMDGSLATLASGANFPDALCAAPISWWTEGPILLTEPTALSPAVGEYFAENGSIGHPYTSAWSYEGIGCYVIGGTGAISETVFEEFRDLWMGIIE